MSTTNDDNDMRVTKRNGDIETVEFDKILKRIKTAGQEVGIKINYTSLAMKVIDQLYDTISTTKIDELSAEQCASMASIHPDYNVLAGRIIISNHHKNTPDSFSSAMTQLYEYTDKHGLSSPLISDELLDIVNTHGPELDAACDYSRDYLIDYFGFKTLERAYLTRVNGKIIERPQHMWMRVAIGLHGTDMVRVLQTYHLMSQKYFTHATPTLFNAGTPRPQCSSCFLLSMESDSIEGIYNTLKDCALISKWAGGIGLHIHDVRASGSHIRGTNGSSNGIVPMLKVFNNTAKYVDQGGGKRNGSFAIYLEPWHADVELFLQMRKNHGDEELKARDLFYAIWMPDLFMERVKAGGTWTLMCPDECPGLSDVYGDEFKQLYEQYETDGKGRKTMNARDLWFQILDAQMETGTPYLVYKDASNKKSNQKNIGTIKSSNLCTEVLLYSDEKETAVCFTGETQILTKEGYRRIDDCDGKEVLSYFNNDSELKETQEFTKASLINNGEKKIYELECYGRKKIKVTENHLFAVIEKRNYDTKINTYKWKKLIELNKDDRIAFPKTNPLPNHNNKIFKNIDENYLTVGWLVGDGWQCKKTKTSDKLIYGACFGPNEIYARDRVITKLTSILGMEKLDSRACANPLSLCTEQGGPHFGRDASERLRRSRLMPYGHLTLGHPKPEWRLNEWLDNAEFEKFGYNNRTTEYYTDKKTGVFSWVSSKTQFIKNIQDNFGLMPHTAHYKVIPDKIKIANPCQKASFLSGLFSADGNVFITNKNDRVRFNINLASSSKPLLDDVQNMLKEFGIESLIIFGDVKNRPNKQGKISIENKDSVTNFYNYINFVLCKEKQDTLEYGMKTIKKKEMFTGFTKIKSVNYVGIEKVYDLNVPNTHNFIAEGFVVHNCNLASIALPAFIEPDNNTFNYEKLHEIAKVVTYNLNKVIDMNYYPTEKTRRSNMRHRPVGIGIQGLADTFMVLNFPFDSDEAKKINRDIFETIYHAALEQSCELAMIDGPYETFPGSPASQGILQFDMWNMDPGSSRYDWTSLKQQIMTHGIRNSTLLAPMPTASTSQILGYNECIEPITSNIYSRRTIAGEFIMANKYLMADLLKIDMWNEKIKNNIIANNGSIQHIDVIPEDIRMKYRTVWEIPMKSLIDMAAERGAYICQSQSLNLWLEDPNYNMLTSMHFYGWKKGLKTGIYYLRRRGAHKAQQFTIEAEKKQDNNNIMDDDDDGGCLMCGS